MAVRDAAVGKFRWLLSFVWITALMPGAMAGQEGGLRSVCRKSQMLVGIALPDTVEVDLGFAFRVLWEPDDVLRGQKFLVERARPEVPSDTVVLVKWNRSPDSPPYRWRDPAQWIEPGSRRLVDGVLRDPEHWTSGLPTLDVRGSAFPDPDYAERVAAARGELMTADEYFDFCSMQVDLDIVRKGDWSEVEPLSWARESGGAWSRFPAAQTLYSLAREIEDSRIGRLPVDVGGTYAAQLELPSGRQVEFFFRTSGEVSGAWGRISGFDEMRKVPPWEYRKEGYKVRFWIALDQNDLPRVQGDPSILPCRRFLERMSGDPPREVDPSCLRAEWPWRVGLPVEPGALRAGLLQPRLLVHIFGDDDEVRDFMDQYSSYRAERRNAGEEIPEQGEFLSAAGAGLQYRQTISATPGGILRLTAVRISSDVVIEVSN
jgi:hypothetical protein